MASTYSPLLRFELPASGEQAGLWGNTLNNQLGTLLEQAIAGVTTVTLVGTGDYTLSTTNGTPDEARSSALIFGGTPGGPVNIIVPSLHKTWIIRNGTPSQLTIKTSSQIGGPTIAAGAATTLICDGSQVHYGITAMSLGQGGTGGATAAEARASLDVPTRTGGDASGTWGINITGNAATATSANNATTVTNGVYTTEVTTGAAGTGSANKIPRFGSNGDIAFGTTLTGTWNGTTGIVQTEPTFGMEFGHSSLSTNNGDTVSSGGFHSVTYLACNAYFSTGWKTKTASAIPSMVTMHSGSFIFSNSPLVSAADSHVPWTQRFIIFSNGQAQCAGFITSSDARFKKDLVKVTHALPKIRKLFAFTYGRTDDVGDERYIGLMAQDVQKVVPEAVKEDSEGKLNVAYGNLVALAFEGIKALDAMVKQQQNAIKALEARILALEGDSA